MKVYTSIDEALEDISFDCSGYNSWIFREYNENDLLDRLEIPLNWFSFLCRQNGIGRVGRSGVVLALLTEVVVNANRAIRPDEKCSLTGYFGGKGVLLGTRQDSNFLNSKQIEFLKSGEIVPTTKTGDGGIGTYLLIHNADGLLINEKDRELYFSVNLS